ncbi:MAG: molybdenum ABC transporter permease [Chitinophaga sp.]|uniref:molybdenum ABC transporter permease n=1 Tax=Chitinophaga sp. TaxID=1869181 RepID=UPI0025BD3DA7|nr:molybdenum ABC transporter permease [Chitinophaga sp.]MBV8252590.1 molybdenum ABC transporter permease [Chitinophaga sp.]
MVLILGICMTILGLALRVYVSRNRFYRRGVAGLQEFSSYRKSVAIPAFERLVKIVGTLLMIGGLFLCFLVWFNAKEAASHRAANNADTSVVTSAPKHKKHKSY